MRELCIELKFPRERIRELANTAGRYYRSFDIRSANKLRHIDEPLGALAEIQHRIKKMLERRIELPEGMFGGVKRGSPLRNAKFHARPSLVAQLDVRNFFPSISPTRVLVIFIEKVGCTPRIARLLTKLTTFHGRLPQGAATSSLIANLALHDTYEDMRNQLSSNVSTFVDDVALSGTLARADIGAAVDIVRGHGFAVKAKKVQIETRHRRGGISITGIDAYTIGISRERRRSVRHRILSAAHRGSIEASELASINGAIRHTKSINVKQGAALQRSADKFLPGLTVTTDLQRKSHHKCVKCTNTHKHRPYRRQIRKALF